MMVVSVVPVIVEDTKSLDPWKFFNKNTNALILIWV
jgi:hypothetical protein